jgi:hypothetical protein
MDTLARRLGSLADPVYGIVDVFLDRPLSAAVTTSVIGVILAVVILSLR